VDLFLSRSSFSKASFQSLIFDSSIHSNNNSKKKSCQISCWLWWFTRSLFLFIFLPVVWADVYLKERVSWQKRHVVIPYPCPYSSVMLCIRNVRYNNPKHPFIHSIHFSILSRVVWMTFSWKLYSRVGLEAYHELGWSNSSWTYTIFSSQSQMEQISCHFCRLTDMEKFLIFLMSEVTQEILSNSYPTVTRAVISLLGQESILMGNSKFLERITWDNEIRRCHYQRQFYLSVGTSVSKNLLSNQSLFRRENNLLLQVSCITIVAWFNSYNSL